jgi:L-lactate dehydrogenase complex protein LldE
LAENLAFLHRFCHIQPDLSLRRSTKQFDAGLLQRPLLCGLMMNDPITLFIQCIVDGLYPEVGEAMVQLFSKLGLRVHYPPDQTCCGQPAFNSGFRQEAKQAARRFIKIFETASVIVCPSGSCVNMVRNHYPLLFEREPEWQQRAARVGAKTYELSEFLVDVLKKEDVGAAFDGRVTYHESCHLLRGLGVCSQPRKLIANVKGAEFVEMQDADRCCGFGGAFSIKYPEISTAILSEKIEHIKATGADAVVGCDMGCLMNIQGMLSKKGLSVQVLHIAQLLAG